MPDILKKFFRSFKNGFINFITDPKEVIAFLLPIIIGLIMLIPVPYYITVGEGTLNLNDKITIENEKEINGSFNSAYVSVSHGNVFLYLLSYITGFEKEPIIEDYGNDKLSFDDSKSNAMYAVGKLLGADVSIKNSHFYITSILDNADTDLEIGDEIIKINDTLISSFSDISALINENNFLTINVLHNGKSFDRYANTIIEDNQKLIGISIYDLKDISFPYKINFDFSDREEGPSGGLMIALTIYNKLTDKDITGGKKIVGTGTISLDGEVGGIGGVSYKLKAAVKEKADIFLVPDANYDEALAIIDENDYNIQLISVTTLNDAIEKLNAL